MKISRSVQTKSDRLGLAVKNLLADFDELTVPEATIRNDCLRRDDDRCMVTGRIERKLVARGDRIPSGDTECAHIIPSCYGASS